MRLVRRGRHGERGAVSTIVVVLLAFGVLLGFTAISVDVGRAMLERRELQNGADAGVMALAQSCADGECDTVAELQSLVDANAMDNEHTIAAMCGAGVVDGAGSPVPCPAGQTTPFTKCPPLAAKYSGYPYVEMTTKTLSGGSSFITNIIGGAIGVGETQTEACARGLWGPIGGLSAVLPLSISICEWTSYTGTDNTGDGIPYGLVDSPSNGWPGYDNVLGNATPDFPPAYAGWPNETGHEQFVMTHSSNETDCKYLGKQTAGGFGWLDADNCSTTVTTVNDEDYWAKIDTGNDVPNSCKDILDAAYGTTILVPVFDCLVKSKDTPDIAGDELPDACDGTYYNADATGGSPTYYHLLGFASFYVSGNKLSPSTGKVSLVSGEIPCSSASPTGAEPNPWTGNAGRCISGWFVKKALIPPSESLGDPGDPNLGTIQVVPAG